MNFAKSSRALGSNYVNSCDSLSWLQMSNGWRYSGSKSCGPDKWPSQKKL